MLLKSLKYNSTVSLTFKPDSNLLSLKEKRFSIRGGGGDAATRRLRRQRLDEKTYGLFDPVAMRSMKSSGEEKEIPRHLCELS